MTLVRSIALCATTLTFGLYASVAVARVEDEQHVKPELRSVTYGRWMPHSAHKHFWGLRLVFRVPHGPVMNVEIIERTRHGIHMALDGGCLADTADRPIDTWYAPRWFPAGLHHLEITVNTARCDPSDPEPVHRTFKRAVRVR